MPPAKVSSSWLKSTSAQQNLSLILLNNALPRSTLAFWKRAHFKICADGGANFLYDTAPDWLPTADKVTARKAFQPDVIKGDLDSIRPEVASFYEKCGTRLVDVSADQDSTDVQKCIQCVINRHTEARDGVTKLTILALGALGGRLDHTLSNLNTLYRFAAHDIVLCGDGNLVRLLPRGETVVAVEPRYEGPMCGLVALGAPATVTSRGLKWDCDGHRLEIGGLLSTSNVALGREVVVCSTEPLLWMTTFRDEL